MKQITYYHIEDIGIDHSQYFSGRLCIHTDWDSCFVGCADTPYRAVEHALDEIAQDGYCTDSIINDFTTLYNVCTGCEYMTYSKYCENCERQYYVCIYVKERKKNNESN